MLYIPKTPERHLWVPLIPVLLPSHPLQSGWEPRKLLGSYDPRPFFPSSPPHSLPFTHPEPVSTFPVGSERLDNPRFHLGPGSRSPDCLFWPYWNPEPSLRASQAAPAPGPVGAARGPPFLRRVTQGQRAPLLLAEAGARTGPPKAPAFPDPELRGTSCTDPQGALRWKPLLTTATPVNSRVAPDPCRHSLAVPGHCRPCGPAVVRQSCSRKVRHHPGEALQL